MEAKHAVRVGLATVMAVVIVFYSVYVVTKTPFNKGGMYEFKVVFDDVKGLGLDAEVRLAGVTIGRVKFVDVRADGKAVVTVAIDKKFKIPKKSTFTIQAGFLQDKTIDIESLVKGKKSTKFIKPGAVIEKTISPATLEDLAQEAYHAIGKVNMLLDEFNSVVTDDRLQNNIFEIVDNIKMTTAEAYGFAGMLSDTGVANRAKIDQTMTNVMELTENLNVTATSLDELINNANAVVGDPSTQQNIKDIVATLKQSSENINDITESLKGLATDEEVKDDVRSTIKSTRKMAENADRAISGFTNMLEAVNKTQFQPDFFFKYDTRADKYFADMNMRIFPPERDVFYMVGLDDVSERSTTNLMFGIPGVEKDMWYRFGLKGGKLGMAMDWEIDRYYIMGELSDPNDLTLNVRAGAKVTPSVFILGGIEGFTDRDSFSVGVLQKY